MHDFVLSFNEYQIIQLEFNFFFSYEYKTYSFLISLSFNPQKIFLTFLVLLMSHLHVDG